MKNAIDAQELHHTVVPPSYERYLEERTHVINSSARATGCYYNLCPHSAFPGQTGNERSLLPT